MYFEIVFFIDPTWFWQSNMLNCVFFRGETEFGDGRYNPFTPTMSVCIWSGTRRFNTTTCSSVLRRYASCRVDFWTLRVDMDKPSWGPINREKVQNNLTLKLICNNPRHFLFQFPWKITKDHDFDDRDNPFRKILNLVCSNGPGWWGGAQGCLERDLESSRSTLRSETV